MKTYKQFIVDSYNALKDCDDIQEALPLVIPLALKAGGAALSAYSAYSAAQNLKKGNYKGAALDALGAIPAGGTAFKAVRALGASKNVARGASAATSAARWSSPARNKPIEKGIEMATNAVLGTGAAKADNSTAPANSNTSQSSQSSQSTAKKGGIDLKKLPGAGLAIRTDLSSPTMRTKSQAEEEQGIESGSTTTQNANSDAAKKNAEAQQKAKEAEEKRKTAEAQKKKNQELNDKLRPDFSMAG